MYKLLDTNTGLYNSGGDHWTKRGKVWVELGHLKTKLSQHALPKLDTDIRNAEKRIVGEYDYRTMGYIDYCTKLHEARTNNPELIELHDLRDNMSRRREVYERYLPKSWKIVKVAEVVQVDPVELF